MSTEKALKDYFYEHYEDNGEPHPDMMSYFSVRDFFKNDENDVVQELIYELGLYVVAKSIVSESMDRLEGEQ